MQPALRHHPHTPLVVAAALTGAKEQDGKGQECDSYGIEKKQESTLGPLVFMQPTIQNNDSIVYYNDQTPNGPFKEVTVSALVQDLNTMTDGNKNFYVVISSSVKSLTIVSFQFEMLLFKNDRTPLLQDFWINGSSSCHVTMQGDHLRNFTVQEVLRHYGRPHASLS